MTFAAGVIFQKQAKWLFFNGMQMIGVLCFFIAQLGLQESPNAKYSQRQDFGPRDSSENRPDAQLARSALNELRRSRSRIEHLEKMLLCNRCNQYPCRDGCQRFVPGAPY